MQKLNSLWYICRQNAIFLTTAPLVIVTDQLSKLWIISNIDFEKSIPETGFFRLTHLQNTGSSFGLFQNQNLILSIVAITGACTILFLVFFMRHRIQFLDTTLSKLSLGLIFGGTLGNLIDRLSSGYVTDFIAIGIWPAFNVADSSLVVGSILLSYSLIRLTIQSERKDGKSS